MCVIFSQFIYGPVLAIFWFFVGKLELRKRAHEAGGEEESRGGQIRAQVIDRASDQVAGQVDNGIKGLIDNV